MTIASTYPKPAPIDSWIDRSNRIHRRAPTKNCMFVDSIIPLTDRPHPPQFTHRAGCLVFPVGGRGRKGGRSPISQHRSGRPASQPA